VSHVSSGIQLLIEESSSPLVISRTQDMCMISGEILFYSETIYVCNITNIQNSKYVFVVGFGLTYL
jgi:hypothetical protein